MSRSVLYTSSPLLASKTPVWRSKFIVAMIGLGFVGLGARAAYVQVFGNDFSSGRARCGLPARWSCPPTAARFWIATGSSWRPACPLPASGDSRRRGARKARGQGQAAPAGQADGNAFADLMAKLSDEDKTFVWDQAPAGLGCGPEDCGTRHQGHLPAQGIQAPVPRG